MMLSLFEKTKLVRSIKRSFKISYLPPMLIFFASGTSGFSNIAEAFFVKEQLSLSPSFLASLAFWVGIPWIFKMPIGHLVDLFWKRKKWFVYLGAAIMSVSFLIMIGLTGYPQFMIHYLPMDAWYVTASLVAPLGFVIQNVVAEAMTVEAVPLIDNKGNRYSTKELNRMHVTMQTLGRMAIIAGSALVAGIGGWLVGILSFTNIYEISLLFPIISVSGVILGDYLLKNRKQRDIALPVRKQTKVLRSDRPLLMLSGLLAIFSIGIGLSRIEAKELIVFLVSLCVFAYLIYDILRFVDQGKRRQIVAIAIIIFVFRATPSFGAGASWWQMDILGFNEHFFGTIQQISALTAILGTYLLRNWMARHSLSFFVVFLTIISTVLLLPFIGLYFGLGQWTLAHFGLNARFIALIDTAAGSPLAEVAVIPMLAWIAKEAPRQLKATYFAVLTAFSNLALSASSISTGYINHVFHIQRENYSQLGELMIWVAIINLVVPVLAVIIFHPRETPEQFE